jgi:hypothetical protein
MNKLIIFIFLISTSLSIISCCTTSILDLTIIFDRSFSIEKKYFDITYDAIYNLTNRINERNSIEYSLVQLSKSPEIRIRRFQMNLPNSLDRALKNLNQIKFDESDSSRSDMGLALRFTLINIFNGNKDLNMPKFVFIFTDGLFSASKHDIRDQIDEINRLNVDVYVIAVGSQINYDNLRILTSSNNNKIIQLDDYRNIYNIVNEKTVRLCNANGFKFITNYDE